MKMSLTSQTNRPAQRTWAKGIACRTGGYHFGAGCGLRSTDDGFTCIPHRRPSPRWIRTSARDRLTFPADIMKDYSVADAKSITFTGAPGPFLVVAYEPKTFSMENPLCPPSWWSTRSQTAAYDPIYRLPARTAGGCRLPDAPFFREHVADHDLDRRQFRNRKPRDLMGRDGCGLLGLAADHAGIRRRSVQGCAPLPGQAGG